jgi:RNA polymerase sigma-70 factor (ECF subfamily)
VQDARRYENVFLVDLRVRRGASSRSGSSPLPSTPDPQAEHLADLISRTAAGDHAAFSELYDLTVSRVYGCVLHVLRSPDHAEEVTQEVYAELWQQAARYTSSKANVLTWMTTIARRRAVDRVRAVSSEMARDKRYALAADPEIDDVWDRAAQNQDIERVRHCLQSLTDVQNEALTLAYFEDLTQTQIASRLNVPLGTVKARMRDAMRRLGVCIGVVRRDRHA